MMELSRRIVVVKGDITVEEVDAIVNAANTGLLGGGGVDGAIHRAAGPALLEECKKLEGCPTGGAKITAGYNLRATWVIHAVGPIWKGGGHGEEELLASCYRSALSIAAHCYIRTIAFPSISTGAYGFPVERAARIAVTEIKNFLEKNFSVEVARIVCFDGETYECYQKTLKEILKQGR
jgi:O-acetyl-ADP-ribose deacetylase (regulator of RNase III)